MSSFPENHSDSAAAELAPWVERQLAEARQRGRDPAEMILPLPLSQPQRRTLAEGLAPQSPLARRLALDTSGTRKIPLTGEELALLCTSLIAPLQTAQGRRRNQILKAIEKVSTGLHACLAQTPAIENPPPRREAKPRVAFQLKITLEGIDPPVWRRFQVVDCHLAQLHEVIQRVMGWQNLHLHNFEVADDIYSSDEAARDLGHLPETQLKLSRIAAHGVQEFQYCYDFGDGWNHRLQIESQFEPQAGAPFPHCLAGERSCPPEDVGGPYGYAEFLRILNHRDHERHAELLDWCGGWFDPDAFDLSFSNRLLQARR